MTREDIPVIAEFIERLAILSDVFGQQAGVGGMETAGGLISYLAAHPRDIEPFLNGGIFELPNDWLIRGCLTYHTRDGRIMHPQTARYARIIDQLKDAQDEQQG